MVRQDEDDLLRPGKKDPTPEQIRRRCAEVQKTWNRRTRLLRGGMVRKEADRAWHWRVPQITLSELGLTEEMLSESLNN